MSKLLIATLLLFCSSLSAQTADIHIGFITDTDDPVRLKGTYEVYDLAERVVAAHVANIKNGVSGQLQSLAEAYLQYLDGKLRWDELRVEFLQRYGYKGTERIRFNRAFTAYVVE